MLMAFKNTLIQKYFNWWFFISGARQEQDIFVRLIDSQTKQVGFRDFISTFQVIYIFIHSLEFLLQKRVDVTHLDGFKRRKK